MGDGLRLALGEEAGVGPAVVADGEGAAPEVNDLDDVRARARHAADYLAGLLDE